MKHAIHILAIAALLLTAGCNTVQGVGKDVQKLGGGHPHDATTTTTTKVQSVEYRYP